MITHKKSDNKRSSSQKNRILRSHMLDPEHYFYSCDGAVVKDLDGLVRYLGKIDDGAFRRHVKKKRNDFSRWVQEKVSDKALAKKMHGLRTPGGMRKAVERRLK